MKSIVTSVTWSMAAFAVLCFTAAGLAQTPAATRHDSIKQKLDTALEQIRSDNNVPALAIGIIDHGRLYYRQGFGLTATGQALSANSKFRVASITKLLTAQAVMQLVEKDQLSLDDKVGQYLPAFVGKDISLAELMTHHSGLSDKIRPQQSPKAWSVAAYLQASSEQQLPAKKAFEYADLNFNLLGAIVAKVSGSSYPDYIKAHIIEPLNLNDSGFNVSGDAFLPDTVPYINGQILRKAPLRPFDPAFAPSEGLVTSAHDLLSWLAATLSHDPKLLQADTYRQMLTAIKKTSWQGIDIGLGWQLYKDKHGQVIRHAGSFKGVKALLIAYPDIQRGMVIISNADELPRWDIATAINGILDGHQETLPSGTDTK